MLMPFKTWPMKHFCASIFLLLLLVFSLKTAAQSPDTVLCANCPSAIPDYSVSNFYFQVAGVLKNDLKDSLQGVCGVHLRFTHDYIGDLEMRLISPAGQSVNLIGPVGFFGASDSTDWNIQFVPCSGAAVPDTGFSSTWNNNQLWGLGQQFDGSYYPNNGCLEQLDSGSVNGIWRLEVRDDQQVDVGYLYEFQVIFCDTAGMVNTDSLLPPIALMNATTAGWTAQIHNNSLNAATYELSYGDGEIYTGPTTPPDHVYADTGTYLVRLIATNAIGSDTAEQTVVIAGLLPSINGIIAADPASGCAPLHTQFYALDPDHVTSYSWSFPLGVPAQSSDISPQVQYNTAGSYDAVLVVINDLGSRTYNLSHIVQIEPDISSPVFTVQVQGDSILATLLGPGYSSLYWSVDGLPTAFDNPVPVFVVDTPGIYQIGLTVLGYCGDTASTQLSVQVIFTGAQEQLVPFADLRFQPNPTDGQCRLTLVAAGYLPAQVRVLNAVGQTVYVENTQLISGQNTLEFRLRNLPDGLYVLRLQTESGERSLPFVIKK